MASHTYDPSPAAQHAPLTRADVAHLLATDGAAVTGSAARLRILLSRMAATLEAHAATVTDLHRSVAEVAGTVRAATDPVAAALTALAALDTAGQRQVYDVRADALLDAVDQAAAAADRALAAARNESLRNRFVLAQLLESPELDERARAAVEAALSALVPADAPLVVLDTPRLSTLVAAALADGGFTVAPADADAAPDWDDLFADPAPDPAPDHGPDPAADSPERTPS